MPETFPDHLLQHRKQRQPGHGKPGLVPQHPDFVVVTVEPADEIDQVKGDAVRLEAPRASLQDVEEIEDLLYQFRLFRQDQLAHIGVPDRSEVDALAVRHPEYRFDAGMGVLHVVDRVFVGGLLREVEIEFEVGVALPHEKEEPCRIRPHLVQDLSERRELSRPRGHSYGLAFFEQGHKLDEEHLEGVPVAAQRLDRGLEPLDVPVVIGPPDIDKRIENRARTFPGGRRCRTQNTFFRRPT